MDALFPKAEEGGFWFFPDIPKCLTQDDDMTQAYEMTVEALGLALTSCKEKTAKLTCRKENFEYH